MHANEGTHRDYRSSSLNMTAQDKHTNTDDTSSFRLINSATLTNPAGT